LSAFDRLRCPFDDQGKLRQERDELMCSDCGRRFPIRDGVPMLRRRDAISTANTTITP